MYYIYTFINTGTGHVGKNQGNDHTTNPKYYF